MNRARIGLLGAVAGLLALAPTGGVPMGGVAEQSDEARALRKSRRRRNAPEHIVEARRAAAQAKRDRKAAKRLRTVSA